jgi:predicted porin
MKMKLLLLLVGLLVHGTANARVTLKYNYVEFSMIDVGGNNGDQMRFGGSFDIGKKWLLVGAITTLSGNNTNDETVYDVGIGRVWNYERNFDVVATFRFINAESDGGNADENGFAFSAGARRLLAPQLEIHGTINHISTDTSDTYFELGGDYYFSDRFSAGASLEFAGDSDTFTIGARWFFK